MGPKLPMQPAFRLLRSPRVAMDRGAPRQHRVARKAGETVETGLAIASDITWCHPWEILQNPGKIPQVPPNSLWFLLVYDTNSAAQGGGGSFKNRKPIGEIGCCEPGMAERIQ